MRADNEQRRFLEERGYRVPDLESSGDGWIVGVIIVIVVVGLVLLSVLT
jgi:hypothetical protein